MMLISIISLILYQNGCIHYKLELYNNIDNDDLMHLKTGLNKTILKLKIMIIILITNIKLKN